MYQTVYDITNNPEIFRPPYANYALLLLVFSLFGMYGLWKKWKGATLFCSVALIAALFAPISILLDRQRLHHIRKMVAQKTYLTTEGCLTYFHPGAADATKDPTTLERWQVGEHEFAYASGSQTQYGYIKSEAAGGAVHSDTRVRVSFIPSSAYPADIILRLDVLQKACPSAPDSMP